MQNMKSKIIAALTVVLAMTSCHDFLEPKSQSEYIPREVSSLNEMLLGNAYIGADGNEDIQGLMLLLDDDIQCSRLPGEIDMGSYSSQTQEVQAFFTWQPDEWTTNYNLGNTSSPYESLYDYIMGANAALDYIDDVSGTTADKNNVRAQALALRAYYYYLLVNLWGEPYNYNRQAAGVPLILSSALSTQDLPRNSVEEVYNQIVADLLEAEQLYQSLDEASQFRRDFRTSLPMVQLLLSRVYLYMENWEQAAAYAQKVMRNSNLSLADLNSFTPSSSSPYYCFVQYDCPETIWVFGSIRGLIQNANLEMNYNLTDDWGDTVENTLYKFNASDSLLSLFDDNDLRLADCLVTQSYYNTDWESVTAGYLPFAKFKITTSWDGSPQFMAGDYFATSFRLSEAYLNYAEAEAMLGDSSQALQALQTLQRNRYAELPEPSASLLTDIRNERRKELCFEGQRWFDLRRWGMPEIAHDWSITTDGVTTVTRYVLQKNDPSYTMPIPDYIRLRNRALTQNTLAPTRQGTIINDN